METEKVQWPGWETVRLIGRGSYGAVYEIQRDVFGYRESAALKIITIPQNDSDIDGLRSEGYDDESITNTFRSYLQNFINEYTLMSRLNGSANIVNCQDLKYVQHDDGIGWDICIKMELLTPLMKAFPGDFSEDTVLRCGRDLCRAMELCESYNIVHRDIKPQNIFVSKAGDFKLGDFGIAKVIEGTNTGSIAGTYRYMAPEVAKGEKYGSTADIYSLGLVLYWMLNERRLPFLPLPPAKLQSGDDELARNRRLSGEALPPPLRGSEELKRVVMKACAYKPSDRYSSAVEMLQDIEDLIYKNKLQQRNPESIPEPSPERSFKNSSDPNLPVITEQLRAQPELSHRTLSAQAQSETPAAQKPNHRKTVLFLVCALCLLALTAGITVAVQKAYKQKSASSAEVPSAVADVSDSTANPGAGPKDTEIDNSPGSALISVPESTVFHDMNVSSAEARWSDLVAVEAAYNHTVGLRKDGTVVAGGISNNSYGTTNVLNTEDWTDIVSIAAGVNTTIGLRKDGTVVAIGENVHGQCNVEKWDNITAVAAGLNHTVGLRRDGTVVAAGRNEEGQCEVSGWTDIVAISAFGDHTVGLRKDGTVVAAGSNAKGQCDVSGWTDISTVSAGYFHTVGLRKDGTVVAAGDNQYGQCDVSTWSDIIAVSAGRYHTVGLRSDGTVVAIGNNYTGRCDTDSWTDIVAVSAGQNHTVALKSDGTPVTAGRCSLEKTNLPRWEDITAISAGYRNTAGLRSDGTVICVGNNQNGQCNVSNWTDIVAIASGEDYTIGLRKDGTVASAGNNGNGQLLVDNWTDIVAVGASFHHTVGLRRDGTVVASGLNEQGQCNISDWTDITAIAPGWYHTVGLKSDGTVVAAGSNYSGQCDVSTWKDIVDLAAGCYHTIGLRKDGTVVAAGGNQYGQCDVSSWTDIVAIARGCHHTVGLRKDGTVVAAGLNNHGQCDVSEWTDIIAIAAGAYFTVGIRSDGTVVAVGLNASGQCDVDLIAAN